MRSLCVVRIQWMFATLCGIAVLVSGANAQPVPGDTVQAACLVELSELRVNSLKVQVNNTSGKPIVGMVFNVAFSDATERWKWLHWNYDLTRPLQEFGWNKPVKPGESKKVSWGYDLEHEHGGGVALVLTSILFADGSRWEDGVDSATCKIIWYHSHKKGGFTRPVELPPRD